MMPVLDSSHVTEALDLLTDQFQGKPNIAALLSVYARRTQELENVLWDVINLRVLANATGGQLDVLGKIVGEGRQGRQDSDYKAAIKLRIRVNRSQGLAVDIIAVGLLAIGSVHRYSEFYPAAFEVELINVPSPIPALEMFTDAKPSGVYGVLLFTEQSISNSFIVASSSSTISGAGIVASSVGSISTNSYLSSAQAL